MEGFIQWDVSCCLFGKLRISSIVANSNHWQDGPSGVTGYDILYIREETWVMFCYSYQSCDGAKEFGNGEGVALHAGLIASFWLSQLEKNRLWAGRERERSLIIPTCARLQWEGRDEAISCLSTGTTKSLYTSVSYFLFWHNQSSKLSRHDWIWQVPRTLAKLRQGGSSEM